jgi:hypothetical protein
MAGCGSPNEDQSIHLADRLQGNWAYQGEFPDQGFRRTEYATLAVHQTTLQYTYTVSWECPARTTCPGEPPVAKGNYFEGVYTDLGDSLDLRDALEPVSFRNVKDSTAEMHVGGFVFPLRRN